MTDGAVVALEIGNAQGHDVDTTAAIGQVHASIHTIAAHEPDPATVLTRTEELLVTMGAARFASCTMLHLDPRDGWVTGASAAHVLVLSARKDGSHSIRELPRAGPGSRARHGLRRGDLRPGRGQRAGHGHRRRVEGPGLTLEDGLERAGPLVGAALHDGLNAEETADRILDAAVAVVHLDDVAVVVFRRVDE
ncbi:SpoIIE family protein phosphatase [Streptomyces sp. NPDC057582]|uniref:SpoIIE family protein phosphatase n=1 Tax=Streptomyces sp. NPDC057582 TaxID=3346174 RepID=UPI0036B76F4E